MTPDLSGLTLAERILSVKAGRRVTAGEIVVVLADQVMVVDSIAPAVFTLIERELDGVIAAPERISVVIDHVAPASSVQVATTQKGVREYARERGLRLFDVGRGICHQILFEEGLAQPGWVVLGADSHSTTYGAACAFGTGMGASDIALAVATGKTWLAGAGGRCGYASGARGGPGWRPRTWPWRWSEGSAPTAPPTPASSFTGWTTSRCPSG